LRTLAQSEDLFRQGAFFTPKGARARFCPEDKTIDSINVYDREFDGNCPEHKVKLQPLSDLPKTCPKCGGAAFITKKDILKPERGE